MNIKVVIGANFGDEGKGLMTDYLCHKAGKSTLNIRFNSGAQAGHTVCTPDGDRHVFGHLGSGSFAGAHTYLSRYFVCNPLLFIKENNQLHDLGWPPFPVSVSPNCMVTTPYDMIINQVLEKTRGNNRHGSCGVGFHETIQRTENHVGYKLFISDLVNKDTLAQKLKELEEHYLPFRLGELGLLDQEENIKRLLDPKMGLVEQYIADCMSFKGLVDTVDSSIYTDYENLVFEGAQGLGLDQDYGKDMGYFPHVTHSNTGLKNVVEILKENNLQNEQIDVIYVTRPYMTRHGAGPLKHELSGPPYPTVVEKTNVNNQFQGGFRFGWMDINELDDRIQYDLTYCYAATRFPNLSSHLAITCIDQIPETGCTYVKAGELSSHKEDCLFINAIYDRTSSTDTGLYESFGPTRDKITYLEMGR